MTELRPQNFQAPPDVDRLQRTSLIVGVVALVLTAFGAVANIDQFYRSYLVAFCFVLGPALGSFALMLVHYLSGGAWGLAVRRQLEAASRTVPFLALAFVPVIIGMHHLYEWTHADIVAKDPILQHKAPYLDPTFFVVRAVIYFAVWWGVTAVLTRWSKAQDTNPGSMASEDRKFQNLSGVGLLAYAITITFASFDWVMSLDPHWFSTIFGLQFMVGQGLAGMAFTAAIAFYLSRFSPMDQVLTQEKFHDYGKLMFAFVMLWAYLSYSQFIIIWSANLPEELPWYIRRFAGAWGGMALLIVFGHFVLPWTMLLSRDLKRRASRLALLACFVLVMRYVDLYWNIAPQFHEGHFAFHWMDVTAVVGLFGLWLAVFCWNLKGRALLPVGDPYLPEALADGHH